MNDMGIPNYRSMKDVLLDAISKLENPKYILINTEDFDTMNNLHPEFLMQTRLKVKHSYLIEKGNFYVLEKQGEDFEKLLGL